MRHLRIISSFAFSILLAACGGSGKKFDKQTSLGVAYSIIKQGQGPKPTEGSVVTFTIEQRMANDEILLASKGEHSFKMIPDSTYGGLADILGSLNAGDSAVFELEANRIYTRGRPSSMEGEKSLYIHVAVRSVMSEEEFIAQENAKLREEMADDIAKIEAYLAEKKVEDYKISDLGFYYKVEQEGLGKVAKPGDMVKIEYDGYLPDDSAFETVEERGGDIQFQVGRGQVIRAFDEAVLTFSGGTHVEMYVPAKLAYGHDGLVNKVASDQWVWFDIRIADPGVQLRADIAKIASYLRSKNITAIQAEEGFFYKVDQQGMGPFPTVNSTVTLHYHGTLMDGKVFDSSVQRGEPATFSLGQVVQGWQLGIPKFNAGAKGTLYLPSTLGYGERSSPPNIPPNSVLIFDIEMISFN